MRGSEGIGPQAGSRAAQEIRLSQPGRHGSPLSGWHRMLRGWKAVASAGSIIILLRAEDDGQFNVQITFIIHVLLKFLFCSDR